jgi:competence protein ComEC
VQIVILPNQPSTAFWTVAPFARILPPICLGILLQWYLDFSFLFSISLFGLCGALLFAYNFLPITALLRYKKWQAIIVHVLLVAFGLLLTHFNYINKSKQWYGHFITDSSLVSVKILEPLAIKTNSYKAEAAVEIVSNNSKASQNTAGKVVLYFSKDIDKSTLPKYGSRLLVSAKLQPIKNAGNPGGFDYKRYMYFNKTTHQGYVKQTDFVVLEKSKPNIFYKTIYDARDAILQTLQQQLQASRKVVGIAEALLIGYKEDLDKDLVQAYSNTGVVHIIAISGMHLGLIYVCLVWLCSNLPWVRKNKYVQVVTILACLWLFSLLTGASASVLRSAVMFTCIVFGKYFFRQASIYNSLAASAFLLICYNPFYLWDVGFQLSYLAVVGIVWLQKPLQNLLYFNNKAVQSIWKLSCTTFAAQVFTLPACIYYFHQIPTTFLLTNLIAVPLSTIILFSEVALLVFSKISFLKVVLGKFVFVLIYSMNWLIEKCNKIPLAVIDMVHATGITTILLYAITLCILIWLFTKKKIYLALSIVAVLSLITTYAVNLFKLKNSSKIIVYNVYKHTAIDFIENGHFSFFGDSVLSIEGAAQNFSIKPTRIKYQLKKAKPSNYSFLRNGLIAFNGKNIAIVNDTFSLIEKQQADAVVLTKNANISMPQVQNIFGNAIIVFDAANSLWKIKQWKTQADSLHLHYYDVAEQGAFELKIE